MVLEDNSAGWDQPFVHPTPGFPYVPRVCKMGEPANLVSGLPAAHRCPQGLHRGTNYVAGNFYLDIYQLADTNYTTRDNPNDINIGVPRPHEPTRSAGASP